VITNGSHLVLVIKGLHAQPLVLQDYAFNAPPEKSRRVKTKRVVKDRYMAEDAKFTPKVSSNSVQRSSNDASMAPLQRSSGALHISSIGLKYEKGVLSIILDAFLAVGPVSLALIGFGLGVDLKHYTLWALPDPKDIDVSLLGLAVGFSRPPIELAGSFLHYKDEVADYYAGGAIIAARMYLFAAAGFYGTTTHSQDDDKGQGNNTNNKDDSFTSVFVFAKLDGPLIELEFGEISGVTAGFGYNSGLRNPTIAEVTTFPFVASSTLRDDPAEALAALTVPRGPGWFFPKEHSYWLAAGLTVTAFQILSVAAVAVVQWDDNLKLSIFAVGIADIPGTNVSNATALPSFAHVELGILATLDLAVGVLQVEAELSPNSYILDRNCHPTGGFALYYWFLPGSAHYGDWVFSIGGYHQAFEVPSWYPTPKRVGMSWSLTDSFHLKGSSYFAITPSVCMAGGKQSSFVSFVPSVKSTSPLLRLESLNKEKKKNRKKRKKKKKRKGLTLIPRVVC
jgi:hypothetical protein